MKPAAVALGLLFVTTHGVAQFAAAAETALRAPDRTRLAQPRKPLPAVQLIDTDSRQSGLDALEGRAALVFFGFTNCPNVCPAAMQRMRLVERALGAPDALVSVLISVDGERDTPAVVKAYLEPFGQGFVGYTGPPAVVRDLGAAFSAVFFPGMPTDAAGGYNVEHTSQIYLVDAQGQLAATFYQAPVDDMVAVTRRVIEEKGSDPTDD
jgi:protein SCO1/2